MTARAGTLAAECAASAIVVLGIGAAGMELASLDQVPVMSALLRTAAVGGVLAVTTATFGPLAAAQVHPLLTIASVVARGVGLSNGLGRLASQALGALAGGLVGQFLWGDRSRPIQVAVPTTLARELAVGFVFVLTAWAVAGRSRRGELPTVLGIVSGLAYWMTGSTSAAHPFVLVIRACVDRGHGGTWILGAAALMAGAVVATAVARWLFGTPARFNLIYQPD